MDQPVGFSIGVKIKGGWKAMKDHIWFFIGFLILAFLIEMAPYIAVWFSGYHDMEHLPSSLAILAGAAHSDLSWL